MEKFKMSLTECLYNLAKIESEEKSDKFKQRVDEKSREIVDEFYKTFNEEDFINELKNTFYNNQKGKK